MFFAAIALFIICCITISWVILAVEVDRRDLEDAESDVRRVMAWGER